MYTFLKDFSQCLFESRFEVGNYKKLSERMPPMQFKPRDQQEASWVFSATRIFHSNIKAPPV